MFLQFDRIRLIYKRMDGMGNITGEMLLSQGKDVAPYFMVDDMGLIQGHVGIFLFLVCISLKRARCKHFTSVHNS